MSQETSTTAVNWTEEEKNVQLDELNQEAFLMLLPIFVFCVLLMTIGIPGNILVFLVYMLQFETCTARIFIKAIAVCDLITNMIAIPAMMLKMSHLYKPCSLVSCASISVASTFPIVMSSVLLVCVAFDRWRRVCLPFEWQLSTSHAKQLLIATTVVTFVFVLPLTFLRGERTFNTKIVGLQGTICDFTTSYNKDVYGSFLLVYILIMLLLLGFAYGSISLRLYQQDKQFSLNSVHMSKENDSMNADSTVQPSSVTSNSSTKGRFRVMRHQDQIQQMYENYADDTQQKPDIDTRCNPLFLDVVTESVTVTYTKPLDAQKSKQSLELGADKIKQQNKKVPSNQSLSSATPQKIRVSSSTDPCISGTNIAQAAMHSPSLSKEPGSSTNTAPEAMTSSSLSKEPGSRKQLNGSDLRQLSLLETASTKRPGEKTSSLSTIHRSTECLSRPRRLSRSLPTELDRAFADERDAGLGNRLLPAVLCTSQPVRDSSCDKDTENILAPQIATELTPTPLASKPQSDIPIKHKHSDIRLFAVANEADAGIKGRKHSSLQEVKYEKKDNTRSKDLAPSPHLHESQSKISSESSTSLTYSYRFSPESSFQYTAPPASIRLVHTDRYKISKHSDSRLNLITATTFMMLTVSTISMIFYVPFIVMTLMKISFTDVNLSPLKLNLASLAQSCLLVNSVTNIFIYSVCNSRFRCELRAFISKCVP